MQMAFADCGLAVPDVTSIEAIVGLSLDTAIAYLLKDADGYVDALSIAQAYRKYYLTLEASITLFPGVVETLTELSLRGYWMGIVTEKSAAGLQHMIQRFDLTRYFPVWRSADSCASKPHPAMVLECMHDMGVEPSNIAVVGDANVDMQMAKAAGVRAIGVSFGVADSESLYFQGAEQVVHTFPELLPCFSSLN